MVTVTAPKKVVVDFTNGLSQQEVRSRLRALASTVDTRGWAAKSAAINLATRTTGVSASDRLVGPMSLPTQSVDDTDIRAADDILDEENNASAQRLQGMIDQKAKDYREKLVASMKGGNKAAADKPKTDDYWFLNKPSAAPKIPEDTVTFGTQVVTPGSASSGVATTTADEASVLAELDAHKITQSTAHTGHMHTIKPLSEEKTPIATSTPAAQQPVTAAPEPAQTANAPVTSEGQTAILPPVSNNDLGTAAADSESEHSADDEVVVKLH